MTRVPRTLMAALVAVFMILGGTGQARADEVTRLREAIEAKKAKWVAEDTVLSRLPDHEKKMRARLLKPVLRGTEAVISSDSQTATLPAIVDWTNYDGTNTSYVTTVKDQGNCGSCWAFAATGALESYNLINVGDLTDLSEQTLLSCSGAGSCGGGYIELASDYIRDTGVWLETCYPYAAAEIGCELACYNWQASAYRIASWNWVTLGSAAVSALKNAVTAYGPLVTTMEVYEDFYNYSRGVYSYVSGKHVGSHAILLVGYDDANSCFIVKNSWGTGWGEPRNGDTGGYFTIAYSEVSSPVQFGQYTIAYRAPLPGCVYSISPQTAKFTVKGGTGSISVNTGQDCGWAAQSNAPWITVKSGQGMGPGTLTYSVEKRRGPGRTGTISVADQIFTINQETGR